MKDVHIDPLVAARKEGRLVVLSCDTLTDTCKNQGTRINGLEVTTRHLQDQRECSGHDCDQLGASFNTATTLVLLWFILGYFEVAFVEMDEFQQMLSSGEDEMCGSDQE